MIIDENAAQSRARTAGVKLYPKKKSPSQRISRAVRGISENNRKE